ncbi:SDR family oxidoreductase [Ramlibacter tataouinensis]|uniref:SDR family oxidoreductase n=1 Tax=Ramlibacter tataouinensis TaxID=94132 RepID=UPI0022F3EB5B|nr:SDR family oxidoreductase [Ramlibacter tataouinensis]WBY03322.1 SDR family oxidoreductase [Ramlibacter tataouinensis]
MASTPGADAQPVPAESPSTRPGGDLAGNKVALVIGAGDATGGAIARRFAREGYIACVTRRSAEAVQPLVDRIRAEGGQAHGFGSDARKEEDVAALVERIESQIGPIEVLAFNIGANVRASILDETARRYFKVWEMACFAGFLNGREVARRMVARGRGTILFTGATASMRGSAGFAAFAGAKHALRALAQSMARELGPRGIHVAHAVIDGAIDTAFIRENFPERYARKDQGGILDPEHIADQYWMLHRQPRDAWTHELDLRPWMETF